MQGGCDRPGVTGISWASLLWGSLLLPKVRAGPCPWIVKSDGSRFSLLDGKPAWGRAQSLPPADGPDPEAGEGDTVAASRDPGGISRPGLRRGGWV